MIILPLRIVTLFTRNAAVIVLSCYTHASNHDNPHNTIKVTVNLAEFVDGLITEGRLDRPVKAQISDALFL